ncbi:MAG: four helix bundle protein [Victivallaceae bacterium]|nr:four helix bundle protein [Victivallaceae bacterium]
MNEREKKGEFKNESLQDKSYKFALRIVKTFQFMHTEKNEYVLSKQLLRADTSIGANIEEG